MKIRGVIFDADGPLYYRNKEVDELKVGLLRKFGYHGDYKEFEKSYDKEKWSGFVGENKESF